MWGIIAAALLVCWLVATFGFHLTSGAIPLLIVGALATLMIHLLFGK